MAYVEAHAGLRDHLKTKKVARLLGIPKVQVIGHMLCLWWWCQEYAQNGNLAHYEVADIAEAAEWTGDPQTFVDALLNCGPKDGVGFLAYDELDNLVINDWYQYGGKMFVQREQSAKRMRNMRARNADVTRNDSVTVTHVTPIDNIRIENIPNGSEKSELLPVSTENNPDSSLADQFHSLLDDLKTTTNKAAILRSVYVLCFGESSAPDFGYLGKAALKVGSAGRLAQLMFELVPRPPTGDILAYIVAEENGRKKRAAMTGGNRSVTEVNFANGNGDIYA